MNEPSNDRLVVVANRLPVHGVRKDGRQSWQRSPGGLVSALTPFVQERGGAWIGWTGTTRPPPAPFEHEGIRMVPVALSRAEVDGYYEGFANGTLWPLYHDRLRQPAFQREWWRAFEAVNRRFARAAAAAAPHGSTVWIHDYHLQLVPGMLREARPDLGIGFFLHIPFPPQELFGQLPWRREILAGLLGADVVGFQTRVGAENFAQLCERYVGCASQAHEILLEGRRVRHGAFPISIDAEHFARIAAAPDTRRRAERIRTRLGRGRRILLGVDRLDYTKGIDNRLLGFRELIETRAASVDDVVLVQTAVPSRERVRAYREERARVERLVGEINGRFGSLDFSPVHYLHRNLPVEELVALYLAADVMLVTPLRDGMNLVAKEFVVSRVDERGVLLLSEFTGAALDLPEALLVNPHDTGALLSGMARALAMSPTEQEGRLRAMQRRVRRNDVHRWAGSFLRALQEARMETARA